MSVIKPATPGFLVTLAATILLAIVVFSVPYLHSIYFLKASLAVEGQNGDILLGTLGYCMVLSNGTTCSKPSVGYELNINALVGNKLSIQIPDITVKWITYALVLHIVALILAAISAIFGLLSHIREMALTCCSSCIAMFGAVVALIAFIFDLALFFAAKSRLNKVAGGSASFGIAIWLTLAAWLLLFFSGCFYGIGRCCIQRRPRKDRDDQRGGPGGEDGYAQQMRLDAVKAEADRKNRQRQGEVGLPAFQEYDPSQPLHAVVDHDEVYVDEVPYRDNAGAAQHTGHAAGYVQGALGSRAIDEFNSPARTSPNSYPPQPRRQDSVHTQTTSGYEGSQQGYGGPSPPVPPVNSQYLSSSPYQGNEPYANQNYGHSQGGTSYYSPPAHQQYPSNQYDVYSAPTQPQQSYQNPGFNSEIYNNTALLTAAGIASHSTDQYGNPAPVSAQQQERSYTLGGDGYHSGYGANQVPDHTQQDNDNQFFPSPYPSHPEPPRRFSASPAPIQTDIAAMPAPTMSPVRGPRDMVSPVHQYPDNPPGYEHSGPSEPSGAWGEKR